MTVVAYALVSIVTLMIIYIGLNYVFAPSKAAATFGLREVPVNADAFYNIKGVRDIAAGLVPLALMIHGDPHALGWVILAEAFIPLGDMLIILRHGGKKGAAYGAHGLTCAIMVVASVLLLIG
jgi:hypothetical protein